MASNSVSIPSRMSTDNVSGVTRQSFSSSYANSGNLSRSATASLLPRLAGAVDPFTTDGAGGPKLDESTVLTEDLVNRFRQSIWPPPSIPAFGSWPDATDVLDRARDIVSAQVRQTTLPSPSVSTAFMAKTLPSPSVSTAFMAKTLPLPCVLTAFAAKTLPLPCVFHCLRG